MTMNDRYERQRMIEWWDQDRLRDARVLVAGAGALGNEVLKNLALLGVGNLLVIDFDRIEYSNLSRGVLFSEGDVGRSKVEVAVEALARLNPDVTVRFIDGDLFYDIGLGHYRHSDLVIGCLDSLGARSQAGLGCVLAGIPYLDGGMWSMGGEVRWFTAGDGPCFDCTLSPGDRARVDERRSCSGFRDPEWEEFGHAPTVVSTGAIIAGIQAQEAAKYLCGHPITPGKAIVYNGQTLTMHRAELARNRACASAHYPYEDVIQLPHRASDLTGRKLMAIARADFESVNRDSAVESESHGDFRTELGRDFLVSLYCPQCGEHQEISRVWGKVSETERFCPICRGIRRAEDIRAIDESSPYIDRPLADLGVPPGEVMAVHTPEGLRFYELMLDV